jgi:hypothetical protein
MVRSHPAMTGKIALGVAILNLVVTIAVWIDVR